MNVHAITISDSAGVCRAICDGHDGIVPLTAEDRDAIDRIVRLRACEEDGPRVSTVQFEASRAHRQRLGTVTLTEDDLRALREIVRLRAESLRGGT